MAKADEILEAIMKISGKSKEEIEKEIEARDINAPDNPRVIECYENDGL